MAGHGPPPKPASKRRNTRVLATWGGASPTTGPAAASGPRVLGFKNPHPMVKSMWEALQTSAEARYYSEADWQRAALEMFYADQTIRNPTAAAWAQMQKGLNTLLISPAEKRRCAIELKPPSEDPDENAASSMMGVYKTKLTAVKPT